MDSTSVAIAILALGLGTSAFAEGPLGSSLDIDAGIGGGLYGDSVAGFAGAIGAAVPLGEGPLPVELDAGLEAVVQAASSTQHSQQDYYLLADIGASWKAFGEGSLALRAKLGLGGGWTSDQAGSSSKGMAGAMLWPRLGASYPLGPAELTAEAGYQLIAGAATVKKTVTFGLGCRYAVELGGSK